MRCLGLGVMLGGIASGEHVTVCPLGLLDPFSSPSLTLPSLPASSSLLVPFLHSPDALLSPLLHHELSLLSLLPSPGGTGSQAKQHGMANG